MRLLLSLLFLLACDGGSFPSLPDGGTDAREDDGGTPLRDGGGTSCIDRARWVYVVDSDRTLIRFEPDTLTFHSIGTLDCDASSTPFSMSIDRNATAWVLYQDGRLHTASTADARCTPSSFAPRQGGFDVFGMGFVGNEESETLFISGGREIDIASGNARLGAIDMTSLTVSARGSELPGWPELTGTGLGELWAFFPDTNPATASRLDPSTAQPVETFRLDAIPGAAPRAWAFAFWGGRYYVFLQAERDPSTNVWRLDPTTGNVEAVLTNTGLRIVGAGVSTCAPTELI